tara:strand:+ start:15103 stop:16986 length:1884 start_codon:yes stop_codon:yes gene_type:complete
MARLVRIPPGYGKAFKAKKPEPIKMESTSSFVDVNAQDIMNMLTVAEKIGKSETVGAVVGGIGEGIDALTKSKDGETEVKDTKTVTKVGPDGVEEIKEMKELVIDDPTQPAVTPPRTAVPSGDVTTPPPSSAGQVQEAAKARAAVKRRDVRLPADPKGDTKRFFQGGDEPIRVPSVGLMQPGSPAAAQTPQGAPPPSAIPGPETTRGAPRRRSVDISRPTPKKMRTAALRAGTASGEQAAREIAREEPAAAAPVKSLEDFISKYSKQPTAKRREVRRPVEKELTFAQFQASQPVEVALVVPEKVTYRQLLALSRRAQSPKAQQDVINAYERATGKSRPKTLVERYNRAHEQRDIDRMVKLFPKARKERSQAEEFYKLKRAQLQEAQAATQRAKANFLQERAQLTATQENDLRRRVEAGSPEAKVAYQFALAQDAIQRSGTSAEKARRTRELLELEKAAIASTVSSKLAEQYKKLRARRKGTKGKGRKFRPLTENQEAQLKYKAQQDSITAQKAMINRIRKKQIDKNKAQSLVNSLSDNVIRGYDPTIQGKLISQRAQAQATLTALKADPEASAATLVTAVQVLRSMQAKSRNELNEIIGRKAAIPPAQVSVPTTSPVEGPKNKPEDQ